MMPDATNYPRVIDGALRVTDESGKILSTFVGHDLPAWRRFQLDAIKNFNVVVTDSSMPAEISRTIRGPDKRNDKFVASG
ncbi:MAG: hypothetical protein WDN02_15225 [Methylovirgula sp.]|uniref:hypothetical protein n=1 Tax=Methylovirgula sp. TaxID=1978224 RepID=UPI00307618FB